MVTKGNRKTQTEERMRERDVRVSALDQGWSASRPVRIRPTVFEIPITERIKAASLSSSTVGYC